MIGALCRDLNGIRKQCTCLEKVSWGWGIIKSNESEAWAGFAYSRKILRSIKLRAIHKVMCVVGNTVSGVVSTQIK